MTLVDTSVWIDHFRVGDRKLTALLQDGQVLAHPWVIGELALGHLSRRSEIIGLLRNLPHAKDATDVEVLDPWSSTRSCSVSASGTSMRTSWPRPC